MMRLPTRAAMQAVGGSTWRYFARRPRGARPMEIFLAEGANLNDISDDDFTHMFGALRESVSSFQPMRYILTNCAVAPRPEAAAAWVGSVAETNPYEGLVADDESIPEFARATIAYLMAVESKSNVFLARDASGVIVLLAARAIAAGEVLRTGRPPLYYLPAATGTAYAEKIFAWLTSAERKQFLDACEFGADQLRVMIFGG